MDRNLLIAESTVRRNLARITMLIELVVTQKVQLTWKVYANCDEQRAGAFGDFLRRSWPHCSAYLRQKRFNISGVMD